MYLILKSHVASTLTVLLTCQLLKKNVSILLICIFYILVIKFSFFRKKASFYTIDYGQQKGFYDLIEYSLLDRFGWVVRPKHIVSL